MNDADFLWNADGGLLRRAGGHRHRRGGGIGFEAARALIWLGARVILAEARLGDAFGPGHALFVETDVGSEGDVDRLKETVLDAFGPVDIVINNATITPMGAVQDVPIDRWDASYRVNLRGPVLLAQAFLPGTIERDKVSRPVS